MKFGPTMLVLSTACGVIASQIDKGWVQGFLIGWAIIAFGFFITAAIEDFS